jgi:hypothetical protein
MYNTWYDKQPRTAFSGGPIVGPGLVIDTNRFYVVFLDAIGLYGASKPSGGWDASSRCTGYQDMVVANYRLLARSPQRGAGGSRYRRFDGRDADLGVGHHVFAERLRESDHADRRHDRVGRRRPGRPMDVPPGAGGAGKRSQLARDQRQLLPPAEGEASQPGDAIHVVDVAAHRLHLPVRSATPWKTLQREVFYWDPKGDETAAWIGRVKNEDAVDFWYRNESGFRHNVNKDLKRIKARTLVVHVTNDQWLMVANARKAAAAVPGATFVTLSDPTAHYGVFKAPNVLKETIGAFVENRFTDKLPGLGGGGKRSSQCSRESLPDLRSKP